ncbi:MAG TPA: hypothetical protein VHI72_14365, partial [Hyphomicrobiaceae bacterium]|nr:hypothetical protein [Hyphomicrobiaceae bacterium]
AAAERKTHLNAIASPRAILCRHATPLTGVSPPPMSWPLPRVFTFQAPPCRARPGGMVVEDG